MEKYENLKKKSDLKYNSVLIRITADKSKLVF